MCGRCVRGTPMGEAPRTQRLFRDLSSGHVIHHGRPKRAWVEGFFPGSAQLGVRRHRGVSLTVRARRASRSVDVVVARPELLFDGPDLLVEVEDVSPEDAHVDAGVGRQANVTGAAVASTRAETTGASEGPRVSKRRSSSRGSSEQFSFAAPSTSTSGRSFPRRAGGPHPPSGKLDPSRK